MTKTNAIGILFIVASIFFLLSSYGPVEKTFPRENAIWKEYLVRLDKILSYIDVKLSPLSKPNYTANGKIDVLPVAVIKGTPIRPRISLRILNDTELNEFLLKPGPTNTHGMAIYPEKPDFKVKTDYSGVYHFFFQIENENDLVAFGPITVSISLTETWTEKAIGGELSWLNLGLGVFFLLLGIYLALRRRKPPGLR